MFQLMDKLDKIVWFYYTEDSFNYLVVRGTTSKLNMDAMDIRILQHFMIKAAEEMGEETAWISDSDSFRRNIKSALSWAYNKKSALFFKYKPSDEAQEAKKKYDDAKDKYKSKQTDRTYNKMKKCFFEFFSLL